MSSLTPTRGRRSSFLAAFSTVRTRRVAPPRPHRSEQERRQVEELAAHTWQVLFMAPLWGMEMTNVRQLTNQLRQLERLVKLELDQMPDHQGLSVEVAVVDAIVDPMASVPCLNVIVRSPSRRPPVAQLVLCSDPAVERLLPTGCVGQAVWLPLVLCRGSSAVRDVVRTRLRAVYGSNSVAAGFTQDDMRWMAAMWSGQKGSAPHVAIEYRTPETTASAGLRAVTLQLPCDQMRLIWGSVHDTSQPELPREEMDRFHHVLTKVAADTMGLPVDAFDLCRLVTPLATVHSDGRIRFSSTEGVDQCLAFLRQLAREFFDV